MGIPVDAPTPTGHNTGEGAVCEYRWVGNGNIGLSD